MFFSYSWVLTKSLDVSRFVKRQLVNAYIIIWTDSAAWGNNADGSDIQHNE